MAAQSFAAGSGPPLAASGPTITLTANLAQGSTAAPSASARIPLAAPAVRLQLEVAAGDAASRYRVRIANAGGSVFEAKALTAQVLGPFRFVEIALAPGLLASGDYRIELAIDGAPQPLRQWTLGTHTN